MSCGNFLPWHAWHWKERWQIRPKADSQTTGTRFDSMQIEPEKWENENSTSARIKIDTKNWNSNRSPESSRVVKIRKCAQCNYRWNGCNQASAQFDFNCWRSLFVIVSLIYGVTKNKLIIELNALRPQPVVRQSTHPKHPLMITPVVTVIVDITCYHIKYL